MNRASFFSGVLALSAVLGVGTASAQTLAPVNLKLSFNADGTVNLAAQSVTVRQILAEWARQCGCYVVNAEKLTGAPIAIPVQFERAAQAKVLESLLRQAAGYVLTPRRAGSTSVSNYETIYILATSSPTANTFSSFSTQAPVAAPLVTPGSADDEIPPVTPQPQPAPAQTPPPANTPPPAPRYGTPAGVVVPTPIVPIGPTTPATPAPAGR